MEYVVHDIQEMSAVAREVVAAFSLRENAATILTLSGDLGAGKTAFVKALACELGIKETVTSPTFALMRTYIIPEHGGISLRRLVHIDAYRLDEGDTMASLGWHDIVADPCNLVCIEWPERVEHVLPKDMIRMVFTHVDEETRKVCIEIPNLKH